jgi:DeoR family fructose operon transcriptional repressor
VEGLTDADLSEIRVKRKMFENVKEINLLVASHKFNRVLTHKVAPLNIVNRIITEKIDKPLLNEFNSLGIDVEIARK